MGIQPRALRGKALADELDSDRAASQLPDAGDDMEFHHAPKVWLGWRDFLREYLIVVVGVLTAAGVGLVLEGMRRHAEVAEARRAIRFEIARNADIALFSIEEERCRGRVIDLTVAWLNGGPRPQIEAFGLGPVMSSAWDVAKTGPATFMPFEERQAYSNFYEQLIDTQRYLIQRERDAGMLSLGFSSRSRLTPADKQAYLDNLYQIRLLGQIRVEVSTGMVQQAKAMGVAPAPMSAQDHAALNRFCALVGMTPSRA